jgi:hypothetical protein
MLMPLKSCKEIKIYAHLPEKYRENQRIMVIFDVVLQYLSKYPRPNWNSIEVEELIRNPLNI